MPFYHRQGDIPKKRHIAFYKKDGKSLYREEHFSTEGFSAKYSNRYRLHMPTQVESISAFSKTQFNLWSDVPLMWQLFHTEKFEKQGSWKNAQQAWLSNDSCTVATAQIDGNDKDDVFFKHVHEHCLVFVRKGAGVLKTEFGDLPFVSGDYLNIPKGLIFQFQFDLIECANQQLLVVYSRSAFNIPKQYRNSFGQMTEDAPYCERDFTLPTLQEAVDEKGQFVVHLRCRKNAQSYDLIQHVWAKHPFDVVGWDGYEYPYVLSIHDFAAKVGAIHLPPPVHMVFSTLDFVVCNFVPRLYDFYPGAIPAPYFHSNVDSDEVIYYAGESFMSRTGIEPGSISYHPMGIAHGPQPGKTEKSIGQKETKELAVMIDTFKPLQLHQEVAQINEPNYWRSWSE